MRPTTFFITLALAAAPSVAWAQDNAAFAQQRFTRGSSLYDTRDFANALEEFRASLALYASPNTRLYIARCLRELGRFDEAVPEFERAMREAGDRAATDPRYAATRDAAHNELVAVEPRVGRLTLTIPDAPATASIRVNSREVPVAGLGVAIPVMPGRLAITVDAAGYEHEERQTEVEAGREVTVGVVLRRRANNEGETQVQRPPDRSGGAPPPPSRGGVPRALAWVGFGVGGVGLAGFGVLGGMALSRFNDLDATCGGTYCPPGQADAIASGRTLTTLANVSLAVGLTGLAAGTIFYIFRRPSDDRANTGVRVGVTGNGLALGGVF